MKSSISILGYGYTGRVLSQLCLKDNLPFVATSRYPNANLTQIDPTQRIEFDLVRKDTWGNLPSKRPTIWCFPAMPFDVVQEFARRFLSMDSQLVVLGSTSAYDIPGHSRASDPPPWIDETYPVNTKLPRVRGEEYLRTQFGAIVLRVAGIYGPGRNPLDWIRRGRVTAAKKFVNLIHVEDLAHICLAALERGTSGEIYNVSDGTPRQWSEICREADRRWSIPIQESGNDRRPGKRISNYKLRMELNYSLRHPDLYKALKKLEA